MASGWRMREGTRDDLPRMEPLWRLLYAHHAKVASGTMPFRSADERWPARLEGFERSFASGSAIFLIAEDGEHRRGTRPALPRNHA